MIVIAIDGIGEVRQRKRGRSGQQGPWLDVLAGDVLEEQPPTAWRGDAQRAERDALEALEQADRRVRELEERVRALELERDELEQAAQVAEARAREAEDREQDERRRAWAWRESAVQAQLVADLPTIHLKVDEAGNLRDHGVWRGLVWQIFAVKDGDAGSTFIDLGDESVASLLVRNFN